MLTNTYKEAKLTAVQRTGLQSKYVGICCFIINHEKFMPSDVETTPVVLLCVL